MPERVSVIIPTRNRAAFLQRAVASVAQQSAPPAEVIVVDDGSSDETAEVLAGLEGDGVRAVFHERCRGASAARNTGFRASSGDFVAFLDDDDEWDRSKLARQLEVFADGSADLALVYTGVEVVTREGVVAHRWLPSGEPLALAQLLRSTSFPTSAALIRRSCLEVTGAFDEALPGCQDYDLWIRLASRYAFDGVPGLLTRQTIHGAQITSDLPPKIRAKEIVLEKHRALLEAHPEAFARQQERLGLLYCASGAFEEGRARLRDALRLEPGRAGVAEHLARSDADPVRHGAELLETASPLPIPAAAGRGHVLSIRLRSSRRSAVRAERPRETSDGSSEVARNRRCRAGRRVPPVRLRGALRRRPDGHPSRRRAAGGQPLHRA